MIKRLLLAAALALGIVSAVPASQNNLWSPTTGTVSGLTLTNNYNSALSSLAGCNSGASAPTNDVSGNAILGQCWLDTSTTPNTVKLYDGVSTWLALGYLDATNHFWVPVTGGGVVDVISSATTTNLCSSTSSYVRISGTTTITSFGSNCVTGQIKFVKFDGALSLTYNATSLILPTAASVTTVAGDQATLVYLGGGNWTAISYTRADGTALSTSANFTGAVFFNAAISPSALAANTDDWNPSGLSTANVIRFSCSSAINITGLTAPATNGKEIILDNIGTTNACTLTAQDAASASANRFLMQAPVVLYPLQSVTIKYDLTTGGWRVISPVYAQPVPAGFKNLILTNVAIQSVTAPGTPNNQMKGVADAATLETTTGLAVRRLSLNCTADITSSGAGGLDTGSVAQATWYSFWFIYNPTTNTDSCLWSASATTPTMPSGYTYRALANWNYVENAVGKRLNRVICRGLLCQFKVTSGTATATLPLIASGVAGTWSTTTPTYSSPSIASVVPPTASAITVVVTPHISGGTSSISVAPSSSYSGEATTNFPWITITGSIIDSNQATTFLIEGTTIGYASSGAGGAVACAGWSL